MKRRVLLAGAGAGGATLAGLLALGRKSHRGASSLRGRFRVPGTPVAVGRRYLADNPAERDAAALRRAVEPEAGWTALASRMAADLDAGRTARVAGWVMSISEARLYALLALEADD